MITKVWELACSKEFFDHTATAVAVMTGKRLNTLSVNLYGQSQIEDAWREFFCISANLTKARMEIHRRGSLAKYVRASMSLPV